jgi:hypothetical protein
MSEPLDVDLQRRMQDVGRRLGVREADHSPSLADARKCADGLRQRVVAALDGFHEGAAAAGAPHLRAEVSRTRLDDKHVRAVEFSLQRGRHRAIVTVKSRGEVTLVGPFKAGKTEGPCRSFPMTAESEISAALGDFLERFLEEAATP